MIPDVWGRRAGEHGRFRGCVVELVVLIVLCAGALVLLVRLTGTPDLAAAPVGPDDGGSPLAIATALGGRVGVELAQPGATGATVMVSEQDLSTLAATDNPDPDTFTHVQVRARAGQLWITADSHLGPLPVVMTAKLTLSVQPGGSITSDIKELDVGDQVIPGFIRSAVDSRGNAIFSLTSLLNTSELTPYGVECVAVIPDRGLELGFHEPRASADSGYCAAHPLPPEIGAA